MTPEQIRSIPMSSAALAAELGVNPATVRLWKSGAQVPRGKNARRLERMVARLEVEKRVPLTKHVPKRNRKRKHGLQGAYPREKLRKLLDANLWGHTELARRVGVEPLVVLAWLDGRQVIPGPAGLLLRLMETQPLITEPFLTAEALAEE